MAINGIDSRVTLPLVQPAQPRTAEENSAARGEAAAIRREPVVSTPAESADTLGVSLPAAAPAGTDPALWAVLTSEERAYFARVQSLGPLTYGRGERTPALPRGGRIDVQV